MKYPTITVSLILVFLSFVFAKSGVNSDIQLWFFMASMITGFGGILVAAFGLTS